MTAAHWRWLEKAVESMVEGVNCLADLPREFALLFEFSPARMDEEAKAVLESKEALEVIRFFAKKIS